MAKKYSHATYLASPTNEPEHQVVLIVFTASLFSLPRERENLLQQARRLQKLQYRGLAPIMDIQIEEEQPFVVREYLPNGSLRSRLKSLSPQRLELREALNIVLQVGQALAYAHEHQELHGSLKPENILFDANGQTVLTDFNLVHRNDAVIRDQTTEEYAFCYLAPEQFAGACTPLSDQYALGCLAYELITRRVPFVAQSLASMMGHSGNALPPKLSESVADLPPSLETAVLKTLAQDPDERFSDCSLFVDVLQSILSPTPAFPFIPSIHLRKDRTLSHPVASAKAESVTSPIRKRAAKRATLQPPEPSKASSSAQVDIRERVFVPPTYQASTPEQREMASRPLLETPTSEMGMTTYITEEETGDALLTNLFREEEEEKEEEEDRSLGIVPLESFVDGQSEFATGRIPSLLTRRTNLPEFQTIRVFYDRRRPLVLALLFSTAVVLIASIFWPFRLFTSNVGLHTTNNSLRAHLTVVPTATPTPTPMPTATPRIIPTTTPPVKPTATVLAASSNSYSPYSGKLTLDDPLGDNSRGYGWDQSSGGSNRFCQFIGGAYHAAAQSSSSYQTCYTAIQAGNFAFEVQMQVVKGNCGGLEWRDTTNKRYGYHLRVCQDGSYE
ncbi:MAG TPA: serine/threonine-protein kinase, partial [Ktedonobacteraceae bacterium]|nr:serine/threonine-protein kinase [Ktedonobacteraceae bacterium]